MKNAGEAHRAQAVGLNQRSVFAVRHRSDVSPSMNTCIGAVWKRQGRSSMVVGQREQACRDMVVIVRMRSRSR